MEVTKGCYCMLNATGSDMPATCRNLRHGCALAQWRNRQIGKPAQKPFAWRFLSLLAP
jgi:hypothetical protein